MVKVKVTNGKPGEHENAAAIEVHPSGALLVQRARPVGQEPEAELLAAYAPNEWVSAEVVDS